MPVVWCEGDIAIENRTTRVVAQCCDCSGRMAGTASLGARRRWPELYAAYRQRCLAGRFAPGDVFTWNASSSVVFTLGVRRHWRGLVDPHWFGVALTSMLGEAERLRLGRVALARPDVADTDVPIWTRMKSAVSDLAAYHPLTLLAVDVPISGVPLRRFDPSRSRQLGLADDPASDDGDVRDVPETG